MQYLTPSAPQREIARPTITAPARGPLWPVPPLSVPPHPILPTTWMTSHPEKHLEERVSGLPAIKAGRPPGPGRPHGQWARPRLAGSPPTAPYSPPSCPATSHAKDNSNSPLGLSRGPLAIDGETGRPPSLSLSLFYTQVCFLPPCDPFRHTLLEKAPVFQKQRGRAESFKNTKNVYSVGC